MMSEITKIKYPITLLMDHEADQRGNYMGYETVEILQFNYDGQGGALARYPNSDVHEETETELLTKSDVDFYCNDRAEFHGFIDKDEDYELTNGNMTGKGTGDPQKPYYKLFGVKKIEYN